MVETKQKVKTLDLRKMPPFERHSTIFTSWDSLPEEHTLRIVNDHDPKPLRYQFEAEQKGKFNWEYEQQGPKDWIVRIRKEASDDARAHTYMNETFSSSEKIGDIVARFPKSGEIFTEYAIDFCCGGGRLLSEAIKEQDLDEKEILGRIEESYQKTLGYDKKDVDWRHAPPSKLIDHILNTHHVYMRRELPQLSDLSTTILRVHGATHGEVLSKVHRLFHNLKMEIDQHLIKEEEIVFPLIKDFSEAPISSQLKRVVELNSELMKEHDGAGDVLKELRKVTDQYSVPEDGCSTYVKTYSKLEDLESNLFQHIHLENNILFPSLEGQLK